MKNNNSFSAKSLIVKLKKLLICYFLTNLFCIYFDNANAQQYYSDPYYKCEQYNLNAPLNCGDVNDLSPAELIYYSALENNINPVLLISKLQDEQSLIEVIPNDLEWKLMRATGYGMADGFNDNPAYYGFFPQTVACTYQFDKFRNEGKTFQTAYGIYTTANGGYNNFRYNIYPDYATRMNIIANTNYSSYPSSYGYYNDFKYNVSVSDIQALLDYFGGPLSNNQLFSSNPQQNNSFVLSNQVSHIHWPFPNTSHNFDVGCVPECNGWYNCYGSDFHTGGDILAFDYNFGCGSTTGDCGKVTTAPFSGTVIHEDYHSGYGNQVIIQSDENPDFAYRVTHLQSIANIIEGDHVDVGDYLGYVGDTGSGANPGFCHAHCVLYKNINFSNYPGNETALDKLTRGESLAGGYNEYLSAAAFYFDADEGNTVNPTTLLTPTQSSIADIPIYFDWTDVQGASSYRIQVATTYLGWSATSGYTTSNNTSQTVPVNYSTGGNTYYNWDENTSYPPKPLKTYYWTVKAFFPGIGEIWSSPRSFTTEANCITPHSVLIYPSSNGGGFLWSGNGTLYQIAVTPYGTNDWWYSNWIPDRHTSIDVLDSGTTYYGLIRSYCYGVGTTEWNSFTFTTHVTKTSENSDAELTYIPQTSSIDLEDIPIDFMESSIINHEFEFTKISPNPIRQNQDLNIEFRLPEQDEGAVQIDVYNINSNKVKSIELVDLNEGKNNIQHQIDGLASGIYVCVITTNGKQYTKKFLVLE